MAVGLDTATTTSRSVSDFTDIQATPIHDQLTLTTTTTEARVDSRLLARQLGGKHKAVIELLTKRKSDFFKLGKVPFQTEALPSGQREKFALLNEDQSFFLLTLSRNNARVVSLKLKLIVAFGDARKASELRRTEYLPGYHALHDAISVLAAGSPNERFMHMNANKLVNKVAGIGPGQRATASLPTQSLMTVTNLILNQTMRAAPDASEGYRRGKLAVHQLLALTTSPTAQGAM